MWVRFTDKFSWKPTLTVTRDYRRGMVVQVPTPCAEAAIAAGKAEAIPERNGPLPRKRGAPKAST